MRMTVIDLEMNQPSGTIIQIGAVVLDTIKGVDHAYTFDALCHPGDLPSKFIENLTGISREDIRNSEPLSKVLQQFWAWQARTSTGNKIAAWGSDVDLLVQTSKQYKVGFNSPKIWDLKQFVTLVGLQTRGLPLKMGLKRACEAWESDMVGRHHNGFDDAMTTAHLAFKVFSTLSNLQVK